MKKKGELEFFRPRTKTAVSFIDEKRKIRAGNFFPFVLDFCVGLFCEFILKGGSLFDTSRSRRTPFGLWILFFSFFFSFFSKRDTTTERTQRKRTFLFIRIPLVFFSIILFFHLSRRVYNESPRLKPPEADSFFPILHLSLSSSSSVYH